MRRVLVAVVLASLPCGAQWKQEGLLEVPQKPILGLYDHDARKEIRKALAQAARSNKRVLLIFGGDWCFDCHVLEHNLRQDPGLRSLLRANYRVVHVDVGRYEKNLDLAKQYKMNVNKGVPALAVLDSDGTLLYSDPGGFFQAARRMTKKTIADFLLQWAPPRKK